MNEDGRYQLFGRLPDAEYQALKEDIALRGVLVPVEQDEHGNILDGHNRAEIAVSLNLEYPRLIRAGWTEEEKRAHVRKLNLLRRHLTVEQRREMIAEQLKETPEKSDRQVAAALGVSHPTVATVREELVDAGKVEKFTTTVGKDGVTQPRERKSRTVLATSAKEAKQAQVALKALDEARLETGKLESPGFTTAEKIAKEARKAQQPTTSETPLLPDGKFDCILADPPWQDNFRRGTGRDHENHYPPMDQEAICKLSVADLAAEDCVLFLWATRPLLPQALQVMETWGYAYKTNLVWVKREIDAEGELQGQSGMGYYARDDHELILIGTRGSPGIPPGSERESSVIVEKKTNHSVKPNEVHERIEGMYPAARRLEMFARSARPGWVLWGAEAPAVEEAGE